MGMQVGSNYKTSQTESINPRQSMPTANAHFLLNASSGNLEGTGHFKNAYEVSAADLGKGEGYKDSAPELKAAGDYGSDYQQRTD